ncbi:uncharacterized protein K452DRAFT_132837 [Aplosporella prunicola CBS 121167]|uniref:Secreted protein n=1 Tax=Aplosporella prunicola CBS 121167 TaxID=1176127 RepID=A0A6A6BMR2_9PEZI|nr:uncharacterized protein K452DRAFT_132837 [Aplosporella prunicola CBS 121167]KAF2144958.1 hypothetical protein K452DRAFT_132837 [Aplosporella prunicola CBS 121167]
MVVVDFGAASLLAVVGVCAAEKRVAGQDGGMADGRCWPKAGGGLHCGGATLRRTGYDRLSSVPKMEEVWRWAVATIIQQRGRGTRLLVVLKLVVASTDDKLRKWTSCAMGCMLLASDWGRADCASCLPAISLKPFYTTAAARSQGAPLQEHRARECRVAAQRD